MSAPENPGIRPLVTHQSKRVDFRTTVEPDGPFSWHTRLIVSILSSSDTSPAGYAFVQRLTANPCKTINLSAQFAVFRIPDYENRIYLYEPGMYGSFNFPVYYGTGQKVTLVVTLKALKRMTLTASSSVITYHDRQSISSGNDLLDGNKKWEVGIQTRIKL